MSSNLTKQVSQIHGFNAEQTQIMRVQWIQAYNAREAFLKDLREEIDGMEWESDKERSNYYSWAVAKYDEQKMKVF